jgi:hypothetical protein
MGAEAKDPLSALEFLKEKLDLSIKTMKWSYLKK